MPYEQISKEKETHGIEGTAFKCCEKDQISEERETLDETAI